MATSAEISVKKMTVRQLVDEYNALSGKAVKSFKSRDLAEEAVRKERASAGHPGLVVTEKTSIKPEQEMPHHEKHASTEATEAEPVVKTLAEMTDEEVIAAAEKLADKKEISLEEAKLEEAALNLKDGKGRDGKKAKASKAPKVEKQPKEPADTTSKFAKGVGIKPRVIYTKDDVEKTEEFDSLAKAFIGLGIAATPEELKKKVAPFNVKFRANGENTEVHDGVSYRMIAVVKESKADNSKEVKAAEKAAKAVSKEAKAAEKAAAKEAKVAEKAAAKEENAA